MRNIIKSVAKKIYDNFGEEYEIYAEKVNQGLKEPCFFVSSINKTVRHHRNSYYISQNPISIQYFPKSDSKNEQCNEVSEILFDILELLEVENDLIRGSEMSSQIIDGVLNFDVTYSFFIKREETKEDTMEELENENGVKSE